MNVTASQSLNSGEDRQQMPAPVVAGERMKFVDDDGLDVLEELPVVDLGRHQNGFEGFGRREQAVGRIGDDSPLVALGRVPVPASRPSSDQVEVSLEPLFLVVQQGPDRADVKDRQAVPGLGEHLRNDREEGRLGLAACGRGEDDEVRPVEIRIDRQTPAPSRSSLQPRELTMWC